ncbi:3-phosphoshikimate 1-carboxyvinyltransferase [Clostridiaceae bacterium 35-E11]
MKHVKITPSQLHGNIDIPPSKSLSHRAIIAAGLSKGVSKIENIIFSDDMIATIEGMKSFGVEVETEGNTLTIKGQGSINVVNKEIHCNESGSTLRFLIPMSLLTKETVSFQGKGRLKERPLDPYFEIFEKQEIAYAYDQKLPLTVKGSLKPDHFQLKGDISSQFITGLLFTLPLLDGDSKITITTDLESKGYVDLTLDILNKFSVQVENREYKEFIIKGKQTYIPANYRVEGDFSQAAFWIVAGILGGEIECTDLNIDSFQGDKVIVSLVEKMQGKVIKGADKIKITTSKTRGITIDASQCPDIVPILTVLAACSEGKTEIINASRLRIKESDRLKAISTELNKLGADVLEEKDGLVIHGKKMLKGGIVDSWNDHRIAMALAVASIKCTEPVIITNSDAVKKSYPNFFEDFKKLGGKVDEWHMG